MIDTLLEREDKLTGKFEIYFDNETISVKKRHFPLWKLANLIPNRLNPPLKVWLLSKSSKIIPWDGTPIPWIRYNSAGQSNWATENPNSSKKTPIIVNPVNKFKKTANKKHVGQSMLKGGAVLTAMAAISRAWGSDEIWVYWTTFRFLQAAAIAQKYEFFLL